MGDEVFIADLAVDENATAGRIAVDLHDEAQCGRRRHRRLRNRPGQRRQGDLDGPAVEIRVRDSAATAEVAERLVADVLRIDLYDGRGDGARHRRMANVRTHTPNRIYAVTGDREHSKDHRGSPELTEAFGISPLGSRVHMSTPPDRPNICTILETSFGDGSIGVFVDGIGSCAWMSSPGRRPRPAMPQPASDARHRGRLSKSDEPSAATPFASESLPS